MNSDVTDSGLHVDKFFDLFVIDANNDVLFQLTQVIRTYVICVVEDRFALLYVAPTEQIATLD